MIERADERLMKLSGKGTRPRFGSNPSSLALAEETAIASSVRVVQIDHIRLRKSSFATATSAALIAILRKHRDTLKTARYQPTSFRTCLHVCSSSSGKRLL